MNKIQDGTETDQTPQKQAQGAVDSEAVQSACQKSACAIQWCLAKNNHQQNRCQDQITAWEDCVSRVIALKSGITKVK